MSKKGKRDHKKPLLSLNKGLTTLQNLIKTWDLSLCIPSPKKEKYQGTKTSNNGLDALCYQMTSNSFPSKQSKKYTKEPLSKPFSTSYLHECHSTLEELP